jgi:hypothetical protein
MTIAHTDTAEHVGRYLSSLIRDRQGAVELHVLQSDGQIELWLLVESTSIEEEVQWHSFQRPLLDRFPDQNLDLRILDVARLGSSGVDSALPSGAMQIELS